jgi:hypothetical protein
VSNWFIYACRSNSDDIKLCTRINEVLQKDVCHNLFNKNNDKCIINPYFNSAVIDRGHVDIINYKLYKWLVFDYYKDLDFPEIE